MERGIHMLEFLILIFVLCIVLGAVFKISIGLLKFTLGIIGALIVIIFIPVGFALLIPILIIALGIGLLKAIF